MSTKPSLSLSKILKASLRSDSISSEPYLITKMTLMMMIYSWDSGSVEYFEFYLFFMSSRNSGNSIVPFPSRSASNIMFSTWDDLIGYIRKRWSTFQGGIFLLEWFYGDNDLILSWVLAHCPHHLQQLTSRYGTTPILIMKMVMVILVMMVILVIMVMMVIADMNPLTVIMMVKIMLSKKNT